MFTSHSSPIVFQVEGSELVVVESLLRPGLSLGVLMVEVRGDGQRPLLFATLLQARMTYAGQIYARPSQRNEVVSDVWVNLSHLELHYPRSCALHGDSCGALSTNDEGMSGRISPGHGTRRRKQKTHTRKARGLANPGRFERKAPQARPPALG